ncbi:hypothetical protein [Veillonella sp.]|jgi:hypothetical protein|uniref:hypothetical protein n=1 Tax=Veillonella sp. TaxID=1926307 RepID=UPI0029006DA1|nr:hypothetical protein [Veillonella sp.]MDU2462728.1 hypothetical protein [Veillonella sp.]
MYEFLRNIDIATWIPIVISVISLIYTIIRNYYSNKRLKRAEKINEENRHKDILIQNLLSDQNIRASIIPYFNIVLEDNKIKNEKNSLILEIGFINIGKESATNIQLSPKFPDEGLQGYIYSEGYPKKVYYINEYLSQYYATTREKVTFKVKVDLKNGEKINDFLRFKIKYSDLIGNEYEQEFRCGFYMLDCIGIGYNLNNTSYKPILLKK